MQVHRAQALKAAGLHSPRQPTTCRCLWPSLRPRLTGLPLGLQPFTVDRSGSSHSHPALPQHRPPLHMQLSHVCRAGWQLLPSGLEAALQRVAGSRVLFFCLMLLLVSQVLLRAIQGQIAAAVHPSFTASMQAGHGLNLEPLDVQVWYTPSSLAKTFAAWGPDGRLWFVAYDFVDVLLFFAAYGGLLLCCWNAIRRCMLAAAERHAMQGTAAAAAAAAPGLVRAGYFLVVVLLVVDLCEDLLQVLLCDTFQQPPPAAAVAVLSGSGQPLWWRGVAAVCCGVHAAKWCLLVLNGGLLLVGVAGAWLA